MITPTRSALPVLAWFVAATGMVLSALPAPAQLIQPLLGPTHAWRCHDLGVDLGTGWRTNGFDDSTWLEGQPLFGVEPSLPFPYASAGYATITTPLALTRPGGGAIGTHYFRTRFQMDSANPAVVMLRATNLVDDGLVAYLNGTELFRFNMPAGAPLFSTFAVASNPGGEPVIHITNLTATSLVNGENLLAVELHQSSFDSSDAVFGLSLSAVVPQALVITNQPASLTNLLSRPASFNVGVAGGPVSFQWRKNDAPIAGATGPAYTIANAAFSHSGDYTVVVSNILTVLTSAVARLTVVPDNFGPRALTASVPDVGTTNQITVMFNEKLMSSTASFSAATSNNFAVLVLGTSLRVDVTAFFYNSLTLTNAESAVIVRVGGPHWDITGATDYVVTINGVKDAHGNVIAPDTQVAVARPRPVLGLIAPDSLMDFHAAAVFEPEVYGQLWQMPEFVPGSWWGRARGPFCGGVVFNTGCLGAFQFEMGYQSEPYLFRVPFQWPTNLGAEATLRLVTSHDDGYVAFLNGLEILRVNVATGVTAATRTVAELPGPACASNSIPVTNLRPGTNWLACALVQSATIAGVNGGDAAFAAQLNASATGVAPPLPAEPVPKLVASLKAPDRLHLSWVGSGYALEFTTHLPADSSSPWLEVTNMSNPFTNTVSGSQQFFRLQKASP